MGLFSCSSVSYLWQASRGQMELLNRSRPISDILNDERTPPSLKTLLSEVGLAKAFGEERGLRATPNYADYIALDRAYVVWVVTASEELSFQPKIWSFPVVGSFNYLGWFSEHDAEVFAGELSRDGWDVDVRGASAYSTLGWFKDPILSTMIQRGKKLADLDLEAARADLVNVVIHESVHATLYVKDQSLFNESLASFVADILTREYFHRNGNSKAAAAFERAEAWGTERHQRFHDAYVRLSEIYASSAGDDTKRLQKKAILEGLQKGLKISRPITNATLIQYRTYQTGQDDFANLFNRCGRSWEKFWKEVRTLTPNRFPTPQDETFPSLLRGLHPGA